MDRNDTMDRPSTAETLSSVGALFAVMAPAFLFTSALVGWLA